MSNTVIRVENISKKYQLGSIGTGSLTHDLNRWWAGLRGKEDPTRRIGDIDNQTGEHWALREVSFDIKQGEAVGIIGKNGAGKSTLLKILSRVTSPTSGRIRVKGRIASLLEVGTGFHPDLTGRENIFLNGAILGMHKAEIKVKLDEIVAFSGVEKYIDTPVKRYSSGMYVRLAFAVAAHLESEILILDEVLAVGDIEFQKKCLGKMGDVTSKEGRTVLFVSHNMQAIQKFCNKSILLKNGKVLKSGPTEMVLDHYMQAEHTDRLIHTIPEPANKEDINGYAYQMQIEDVAGNVVNEVPVGRPWQVRVFFRIHKKTEHFIIALGLVNSFDISISTSFSEPTILEKGDYEVIFKNSQILLATGIYNLYIGLSSYEKSFHSASSFAYLNIAEISDVSNNTRIVRTSGVGLILNPFDYVINEISQKGVSV